MATRETEAVERRSQDRTETRFEVVWATDSLNGEGVLRNLSRLGTWIDEVSVPPSVGARIRAVILDVKEEEREPVFLEGAVLRTTSTGFAVELDPSSSAVVELLLDRTAKSDSLG